LLPRRAQPLLLLLRFYPPPPLGGAKTPIFVCGFACGMSPADANATYVTFETIFSSSLVVVVVVVVVY